MREAVEYFDENEFKADNTAARSKLAQEIISQKPGFIERWALLIFIEILLLVLAASWFIKYPRCYCSKRNTYCPKRT